LICRLVPSSRSRSPQAEAWRVGSKDCWIRSCHFEIMFHAIHFGVAFCFPQSSLTCFRISLAGTIPANKPTYDEFKCKVNDPLSAEKRGRCHRQMTVSNPEKCGSQVASRCHQPQTADKAPDSGGASTAWINRKKDQHGRMGQGSICRCDGGTRGQHNAECGRAFSTTILPIHACV